MSSSTDSTRLSEADSASARNPKDAISDTKVIDIIAFDENDPEDPRNWTKLKKSFVMLLLSFLSFVSVFGSSSYAPGEPQIQAYYHVNVSVASAGLTTYVLGFAFGPLICPLSEMYGRKFAYLVSWPILIATTVPSSFVKNIAVIIVFRLFTGMAAGCALNNGSGIIVDLFHDSPRLLARASSLYSIAPLSGPCIGSVVGFFIAARSSGPELWVVRVHFFLTAAAWPLVFLLPETYAIVILANRAKRLRKTGANPNAYAQSELHTMSNSELLNKHFLRPAAMLIYEPIVVGAALWISLAYGILYFFFEAFPTVYITQHHIPFRYGGLPFLSLFVGMVLTGVLFEPMERLLSRTRIPILEANYRVPPNSPEASLKNVLVSCVIMPISLFWFAWTSQESVSWGVTIISGILFGYAMVSIFFTFITYSSRTYGIYASSAAASNTLVRSIIASFLPIVAAPLVSNLGTQWGISLFGFLSFGLLPIPLIFIRYGASLRERSRYAQEAKKMLKATRAIKVDVTAEIDAAEMEVEAEAEIPPASEKSVNAKSDVEKSTA